MSRDLKTVSQFASSSTFTESQLRWWIFSSASNGLNTHQAVIRIGRRVFIDTAAFDLWIDAQNPKEADA